MLLFYCVILTFFWTTAVRDRQNLPPAAADSGRSGTTGAGPGDRGKATPGPAPLV